MTSSAPAGIPLFVKPGKALFGLFFLAITTCSLLLVCVTAAQAIVVLKVGEGGGTDPFTHLNGRQIARNSAGVWFLVYRGESQRGSAVFLAVSRQLRRSFQETFIQRFRWLPLPTAECFLPAGKRLRI